MDTQRPESQHLDEDRFRILVEYSLDAVALIDRAGKVSYVSPSIVRVLGYSADEFLAFDPFQIVHPTDRESSQTHFSELLKQPRESQTVINRVRHKDGSYRWIETVATNQLDEPGIEAIIANLRDVTERRKALDAVRDAEERFRFIVDSATEFAIFTTDLAGLVNSWNSGAARILGYDEAEIIGQDCRIFFTPEDNARDQPESEMHHALVDGRGNDERWHVRKDGSRFWGSGWMMPLRDDEGTVHGYLKIFRDMTREKQSELALKESDRRKDEFLAILAHELRNPLAAISNAAALLLTPINEDQWSKEVIQRQARHLAQLLDGLLDVSRITQGKIRLHQERFDLSTVLQRAIETVSPLMREKMQILTVTIAPGETFVFGDPARIEQVVVNLIHNAMKYTAEEGRISITLRREDDAVVVVQDNGIGIAPEMHSKIFDLFVQVDRSLERTESGLGIGLSLARSIVELHGGTIWVKSDGLGKGCQFGITLPLAQG